MNKSEIYRIAQYAVLNCSSIGNKDKIDILRELIAQEDLALFVEKQEEVKANETV